MIRICDVESWPLFGYAAKHGQVLGARRYKTSGSLTVIRICNPFPLLPVFGIPHLLADRQGAFPRRGTLPVLHGKIMLLAKRGDGVHSRPVLLFNYQS